MALCFPNQSRSYDEVHHQIRFIGHDNVFEVTFCLEIDALKKIDQFMVRTEQGYFAVFDATRDAIERVAQRAYHREKNSMIVLSAADIN